MATLAEMLAAAQAALAATGPGQVRLGQYWLGYVEALEGAALWATTVDAYEDYHSREVELLALPHGQVRLWWRDTGYCDSNLEARIASDAPTDPPYNTIPDVTDVETGLAIVTVNSAGFTEGTTTTEPHPTIVAGNVIRTDPHAGLSVPASYAVDYVESTGP